MRDAHPTRPVTPAEGAVRSVEAGHRTRDFATQVKYESYYTHFAQTTTPAPVSDTARFIAF